MLVAVTAALPGTAVARLEQLHRVRLRDDEQSGTPSGIARFIGDADAAITLLADPVDTTVFTACPRLQIVANYAVGYDNIDLTAARAAGVWITNTPDVLTDATADLTMALLLAVTRRVIEGDVLTRSGGFAGWRPDLLLGAGLQGKRLGIIGYGRIGRAVAARARAFGMEVVWTHSQGRSSTDPAYRPFEELLGSCDVISLHCPATPATNRLLDEERLGRVKAGAWIINTARGSLVDEAALVGLLRAGHLAGAGLDVYEGEPALHPGLVELDNVVLLPHLGSATVETRAAMADLAVANVEAVLAGKPPLTPVFELDKPPSRTSR